MDEQNLSDTVKEYQDIYKQNKNVDLGALTLNALQNQENNRLSSKTKRWAYLISIGAPPLGLLFALKFYFGEEDDAKQAAWMCIGLTVVSILLLVIMTKLLFSSAGVTPQQIEQIHPQDIYELTQ